jgi:bacterioferritin-associated ferredoxin
MIGEINGNAYRVSPLIARTLAFSILDIEMVISNGSACEKCGRLAHKAAQTLAPILKVMPGVESPGVESVVITREASEIISESIGHISKRHTRH